MVKLNNTDEYKSLGVIKLTKERFPNAFAAKVEELLEEESCSTQQEAEFYHHAKCPQVNIFDNELGKYVAQWD